MSLSASMPWRAHYGDTPAQLSYPETTMFQLLRQRAQTMPEHTAYIFQGKHTSYRRFLERVEAAAMGLWDLGIGPGDTVTVCLPNCPQVLECLYGLNRIGAVANLLHPLSAADEIGASLKRSGSKAILTWAPLYEKVASVTSGDVAILLTGLADRAPAPLKLCYHMKYRLPDGAYLLWQRLLARKAQLPEDTGKAEDPAVILYSGGTTGTPKGVLLSNRNCNALALQTIAASGFGSIVGMKVLAVLPNFHGFGLGISIHTALIGGAACILMPRFSPRGCARVLCREKPHIIPGVPALFEALLQARQLQGKDLSFIKGVFCGGDCLSPGLKQRVDTFLRSHHCPEQIRQGYGATECVAAACLMPRNIRREQAVGLPFPDVGCKIVRPGTEEELPAGEAGEICISGPTVMLGYLGEPESTREAVRRHGDGNRWLHTGDLGYMDADGFLYFKQRIKRMIVTNGYNVYPSELEAVLERHETVRLSCVIGVPDGLRGQRVRAYVVPAAGVEPSQGLKQEILAHCARYIAKYALPRELHFRETLPKTPVGKVDYRQLEAQALEENT